MSEFNPIISYGQAPSPSGAYTIVRMLDFGSPVRGYDHFLSLTSVTKHFGGTIDSGELRLVPEGQKTSVKEIGVLTYCSTGETPDVILQMRASDEEDWRDMGDSNGTISVTTTACTGTRTAWSSKIGTGDGANAVFTLPCLSGQQRIYNGSTLQTAYSVTTTSLPHTITFDAAPALGDPIYCYWENEPLVRVVAGDYIETTEGFHRIVYIQDAYHLNLSWYPTETLVGTHHPAKQLVSGEGETVVSSNATLDTLQIRAIITPRQSESASETVKVLGWVVNHVPAGPRQYKP